MLLHEDMTKEMLGCFYRVHYELGYGFREGVYENALMIELRLTNLSAKQQCPIKVYYKDNIVGDYTANIIIENKILLLIKVYESINSYHETQLYHFLRASKMELGYLLNFGKKAEFKRKIM